MPARYYRLQPPYPFSTFLLTALVLWGIYLWREHRLGVPVAPPNWAEALFGQPKGEK